MKRDKIQNSIIKFKDNDIDNEYIECYLDNCDDIKTKGNENDNNKRNDDNNSDSNNNNDNDNDNDSKEN